MHCATLLVSCNAFITITMYLSGMSLRFEGSIMATCPNRGEDHSASHSRLYHVRPVLRVFVVS